MSLPLPYINFNTDTARRLGVGVVLGVLTAVTVMPFLKTNTSVGQLDFVSETIEIVSSKIKTKTPKDVASAPTTAKTDIMDNAVYFPAFAKHMQSMNAYQLDAVINDTPRLALVLNDVGQSRKIVAQILEKIPSAVTVGLSAHTQNHNDVAKQFSTYGFEIWMNMAALTLDMTADRGDHALNPTHNFERNIKGRISRMIYSGKDLVFWITHRPLRLRLNISMMIAVRRI
jgi:hypothetical protein